MGVGWETTVHPWLMGVQHSALKWSPPSATGTRRRLVTTATTTMDAGWVTTALRCTPLTTMARIPATPRAPKLARAIKYLAPTAKITMVATTEPTAWTLNLPTTTELLVLNFVPPIVTGKQK